MYALVQYCADAEYHICKVTPSSSNWKSNTIRNVRWTNGALYPAKVLCTHASKKFLEKLRTSMRSTCYPIVFTKNNKYSYQKIRDSCKPTLFQQQDGNAVDEGELDIVVNIPFCTLNISNDQVGRTVEDGSDVPADEIISFDGLPDVSEFADNLQSEATDYNDYNTINDSACNTATSVIEGCDDAFDVIDDVQLGTAPLETGSNVQATSENIQQSDGENGTSSEYVSYELVPCGNDIFECREIIDSTTCTQDKDVVFPSEDDRLHVEDCVASTVYKKTRAASTTSVNDIAEGNVASAADDEQSCADRNKESKSKEKFNRKSVSLPPIVRIESNTPLSVLDIPAATGRSTRRYFCIYCKGIFANLPQHFEHKHKSEAAVESFLKLPPGSKDRKRILETLRRRGDFEHNTSKEHNTGTILVARRPVVQTSSTISKILTCPECNGQFFKANLRRHYKLCSTKIVAGQRNTVSLANAVYQDVHPKACHNLKTRIFPVLRQDDCVTVVRYDELAICIANNYCKNYADQHFDDMIRAKIRLMGRFILQARALDPTITSMASMISPVKYDVVVEAINFVAGLNPEGTHYRAPTVATTLSTLLKNAANLWKVECLKKRDIDRKKDAEDFLSLLTVCNTAEVNRTAIENRVEHQRQKKVTLPSKSDISKLVSYVRRKRRESYKTLLEMAQSDTGIVFETWNSVATYTLISLLVFNRRRPGELERITIRDYQSLQGVEGIIVDYNKLSSSEKNASRTYKRFEIRGKLNRPVPVLVHWEIELCLDLIIKYRECVGVPAKNPYIFGLPSSDCNRQRYLRACPIMRHISSMCGAAEPHLLRVTILRKQIATQCAVMDLNDNIIKDVANFMGHAENIHNKIYRLPVETRDIVRMSNVLEMIQGTADGDKGSEDDEDTVNTNDYPSMSNLHRTLPSTSQQHTGLSKRRCESNGFDADENDFSKHTEGNSEESEVGNTDPTEMGITQKKRRSGVRFCGPKRSWSAEEKDAVLKEFGNCLEIQKLPSYHDVQDAVSKHSVLSNRSPTSIRLWIENQMMKKRKSSELSGDGDEHKDKVIRRIRWSIEEQNTLNSEFARHIRGNTLPSQSEIQDVMENNPHLQRRSVKCIKTAVLNARNKYRAS